MLPLEVMGPGGSLSMLLFYCIIVASCQSESVLAGGNGNGTVADGGNGGWWLRRMIAVLFSRLYMLKCLWWRRGWIGLHTELDLNFLYLLYFRIFLPIRRISQIRVIWPNLAIILAFLIWPFTKIFIVVCHYFSLRCSHFYHTYRPFKNV